MRRPGDRPKIYDYKKYRIYVSHMCDYLIKSDSQIGSFRDVSVALGFRSQNFLKMVINGERNLSQESTSKIVKGFKLSQKEARFFTHMIEYDQAKTAEVRAHHAFHILNSKIHPESKDVDPNNLKYFTETHYITLREMVDLPNFVEDPQLIGRSLLPRLTKAQVEVAIRDLLEMGYLHRDEGGRLKNSDSPISTGDTDGWTEAQKASLALYHKNMAKIAVENFDHFNCKERNYSGVTAPLSKKQYAQVEELMARVRKEVIAIVNEPEEANKGEAVYRLNLQMFPLMMPSKNGEGDDE